MTTPINLWDDIAQRAGLLDQLPVGITVLDLEGRLRYDNAASARLVDRKPEYIGQDLRDCHQKEASVSRIDRMLEDLRTGRQPAIYYEAERNGRILAVTVLPYKVDDRIVGFIQSFTVKR
jgi:DUF438 domain-containing protein